MGNSILYNTAGALALAINYVIQGPHSDKFATKQAAKTLRLNAEFYVRIDDVIFCIDTDADLTEADLDTGASFSASTTYYVYGCHPLSGSDPTFVISLNATYPDGYTAGTSRKIGGFDTDGASEISEASIWDLRTVDVVNSGISDAQIAGGANISASKLNLAQVFQRGSSTFNGSTGQSISITTVADTDYQVLIEPRAESGFIGEIIIDGKTVNAFVVKNSGSDVTTAFGWTLFKY